MNLTLKPELENFIHQQILAGKYASSDEAIEAALNLLQSQNSIEQLATELRSQIDSAVAQLDSAEPTLRERGEGLDGEFVLANLRAKLQAAKEAR
ncbi:type II toxin-antitoxin system ParD family antitoxin [Chamaesiphon sp. GL140_3_metabinner_50]|uniref:type II toxin-antitoxin system ParD family antitoxin n=1 Tax=Chamaesiphon sp. GL140_3_metabinner_50 TaxID=2970812 RepID=UPI0025D18D57|nr:type II toxin-antitoxin system ParD family antitoxin [Chamaesiphon sp. GL140_3_metabinner_50]